MSADPAKRYRDERDRRAAILRAWHGGDWIEVDAVAAIASTRYDVERHCLWIDLKDGTALVDRGDFIALRGPITWTAAVETVAAAQRHGWVEIDVHGDQEYRDMVTMAAMIRGIPVTNHTLSPAAQRRFAQMQAALAAAAQSGAERSESSRNSDSRHEKHFRRQSSRDIHRQLTKRAFVVDASQPADSDSENPAPVLIPRFPVSSPGG